MGHQLLTNDDRNAAGLRGRREHGHVNLDRSNNSEPTHARRRAEEPDTDEDKIRMLPVPGSRRSATSPTRRSGRASHQAGEYLSASRSRRRASQVETDFLGGKPLLLIARKPLDMPHLRHRSSGHDGPGRRPRALSVHQPPAPAERHSHEGAEAVGSRLASTMRTLISLVSVSRMVTEIFALPCADLPPWGAGQLGRDRADRATIPPAGRATSRHRRS